MLNAFFKRILCFSLLLITAGACFASCAAENTPSNETPTGKTPSDSIPSDAASGKTVSSPEPTTEPATEPTETPADPEQYTALLADLDAFPIAFKYDDVEFNGFKGFAEQSRISTGIENGSETTVVLRHPDISADFELVTRVFPRESAYEYVVYIKNGGKKNTGVFSNLGFKIKYKGANAVLKGIKGDANGQYYTPYSQDLSVQTRYSDRSSSGRPSHGTFPYYNLSYGDGGTFIAIGWPGRWKATFSYDRKNEVTTFTTGQLSVQTYIAPGETLRTPLMAFVEYEGLTDDEQTNAWRHYYINDVMRKIDGELPQTCEGISHGAVGKTTDQILLNLKSFFAHDVHPQLQWVDAGWYTGARGEAVYWPQTGTYNVDTNRFPDKLADVGALTAENDMVFLLWFEPEIVRLDKTAFLKNQPEFKEEWLLEIKGMSDYLVNLGDPECREWVFNKICNVIDTAGVTGYRQDFNTDPARGWDGNDAKYENRTGMTENLHVQGYLALWDAIIERYPGIFMDSCASGGGRNDLESMKRAVPLHYSDWFDDDTRRNDYEMKSRMTQSLFSWLPYFKNELYAVENTYQTRMNYAALALLNMPDALAVDAPWDLLSQAYDEHAMVNKYFYADYYQLTEWTLNKNRWNGWEFYDPQTMSGFAEMFCHVATTNTTTTVKLKGLSGEVTYRIYDLDGIVDLTATGAELMDGGFSLTVPEKPYGVLLMIEKAG